MSTTWITTSKSADPPYTTGTKNAAAWTTTTKNVVNTIATPGLYYGFGPFTYSGGQLLKTSSQQTVWTTTNKS